MARKTSMDPAKFLTEYAAVKKGDDDALVIPEDLAGLSAEDLTALHEQAIETFDALYADGKGMSDDDLTTLASLTAGIKSLNAELASRGAADEKRAETAAALAAEIRPIDSLAAETEDGEVPAEGEEEVPAEGEEVPETDAAETVTASGARVSLSQLAGRAGRKAPKSAKQSMRDVVRSAETGLGMDWDSLSANLNKRLTSFNESQYKSAAAAGRHIREQKGLATFHREFEAGLTIESNDPEHVDAVFARAMDETRLDQGSLVASGGWCAPSETLYDLLETESRDGLYSLPEIAVKRGGINFTKGPTFAELFTDITGFHYTEDQDIAGTYGVDANGMGNDTAGDKPCYKVECPPFEEVRLDTDGLCISAGLLQSRGYPEMIARTTRGALVVRDHRTSGRILAEVAAGSTPVTMTAGQVGATAPLLKSIELQVEHYKYVHRLARNTTLEAVFPFWVKGVIRQDLSQRLGLALFDVTDQQIDAWFRSRGVNPQYVYNWQDITGAAGSFLAWPATVSFLLYSAGTWVKGAADVISLDTIYDSTLLGQNDYIALFIEDAWFVAKKGHDSRFVTVPLCGDGSTHAGVLIDCNGVGTVTP